MAAQAYQGESDILEGLVNVVNHMKDGIREDANGKKIVANPLNKEENFAEKWIDDPVRKDNFYNWLEAVKRDLNAILSSKGLSVWNNMNKSFGRRIVESANKRYTESKKTSFKNDGTKIAATGVLGTIGQALNAGNTFYGEE